MTAGRSFVPARRPFPARKEESVWPDFLPVCTTWASLVAHAAPPEDLRAWLEAFFPQDLSIAPISRPLTDHHMGMNFSRSWGFWRLFKAAGDRKYLKLYLDHLEHAYADPSWWKGEYRAVGHWVAQFRVFALAPVFAGQPAAPGRVSRPAATPERGSLPASGEALRAGDGWEDVPLRTRP